MRSIGSHIHDINVRDLEFENKVWKNKLDYLINELQILIHHIASYQKEAADTIMEPLMEEGVKELKVCLQQSEALKKRVLLQEEEILLYIKDFPIDRQHELFKEHQAIALDITDYYRKHKERISLIKQSLEGVFVT